MTTLSVLLRVVLTGFVFAGAFVLLAYLMTESVKEDRRYDYPSPRRQKLDFAIWSVILAMLTCTAVGIYRTIGVLL